MKEYKLKINGNDYAVTITDIEDNIAEVEVNGTPFKVEIDRPVKKTVSAPKAVSSPIQSTVSKPTTTVKAPAASGSGVAVTSPLPGVILSIAVKVGDDVKKGQKILVLEAMKMENVIEASADGKVTDIKINVGDSVLEGATLVTLG